MDIYFEMAKHPVFTIEDVNLFYDNMNSARSAVKRMLAASKVQKYGTTCTPVSALKMEVLWQTVSRLQAQ